MIAKCLGSSSKGNCYLLQFIKNDYKQSIMIECGLTYHDMIDRSITTGAIEILRDTKSCLITHGHSDHCKSVNSLAEHGLKIFAPGDVIELIKNRNSSIKNIIKDGDTFVVAPNINVFAFKVEHDAPESLGFIIQCTKTNELILFINDCKYFKADLSPYHFDYVFIECNYDDKITRTLYSKAQKEDDTLEMAKYKRVIDSHMSFCICKKTLKKLSLDKCKAIFLMHLSDNHANEYKFKNDIAKKTGIKTLVCQKIGGIK